MSTSLTQIHGHSGACFVCLLSHISSCLRIIYCRSPRNVRTWRYQQGRPLWTQVRCEFEFELGTGFDAVLCKLGRRLAVLLSLLFLHRFNRFIPHHPYRSVSRIGMPLCTQALPSMNLTVFSVGATSGCHYRKWQQRYSMFQSHWTLVLGLTSVVTGCCAKR